ncbi:MAG: hypothetical protein VX210_04555 [Myxococcota bacterium]|nr:hypothetical protein [Myxococcota bacterium]
MDQTVYKYQRTFVLSLSGARDPRAPGGAVTVALCGHWDHHGTCRWPHLSTIEESPEGTHLLTVHFDAPDEEVEEVLRKIHAGIETNCLRGPDGRETTWMVRPA